MPGSTADLAIPYALPADPRSGWPATSLSMSERIEALIRGAEAVVVAPNTGLAGVGTIADPLRGMITDVFGTAPLDKYGTNPLAGLSTYVDPAGEIRVTPQALLAVDTSTTLTAAADPGAWPVGVSVLQVTAATAAGWPRDESGMVLTIRRPGELDINPLIHQWWYRTSDTRAGYGVSYRTSSGSPAVWGPWADVIEPLLPDPVDTYNATELTITATPNSAETPTAIRATIVNPHPTRRMLVRMSTNSRITVSGTIGLGHTAIGNISGGAVTAVPLWSSCTDIAGGARQSTVTSEYWAWIPAGATAVAGYFAHRTETTITVKIRYNHINIEPIRYE